MHTDVVRFVQLLAEPAFLATAAGDILVANSAAAQLMRVGAHDLAGRNLSTIVAEPAEKVLEYMRLCSRSRQLLPGSITLVPVGQPVVEVRCDGAVLITRTDTRLSRAEITDAFCSLAVGSITMPAKSRIHLSFPGLCPRRRP